MTLHNKLIVYVSTICSVILKLIPCSLTKCPRIAVGVICSAHVGIIIIERPFCQICTELTLARMKQERSTLGRDNPHITQEDPRQQGVRERMGVEEGEALEQVQERDREGEREKEKER